MKKRLLATVLALSFIPTVSAFAGYTTKGDQYYELNAKWCVDNGGDSVENTAITVDDGKGNVKYNFFLPFDVQSATISYTAEKAVQLSVTSGDVSLNAELSEAETQKTLKLSKAMRKGEQELYVTVTGNIAISSIRFNKVEISGFAAIGSKWQGENEATDYQKAVQGAVMIDVNANALIVRGQRRYVDNEDLTKTPRLIDGVTYLPARTLALAFGYYIEDIPEKSYLLLRQEEKEYVFIDGRLERNVAFGESSEFDYNLKYINGEAYLPVRFFAEEAEKNVGWSNGIIVIDEDRFEVKNIIDNYIDDVRAQFEPFENAVQSGKTYYVSQTLGSDSNDGSRDFPFATLKKAGETAVAGDTVIIGGGTYREKFAPKNDGTATKPITFKAAEGEEVVISALEEFTKFEPYEGDIYTANLGFDLGDGRNMVFYNGKAIAEARYPNPDTARIEMSERSEQLSDLFPTKGDIHANPESIYDLTSDTLLDQEDDYWAGGTVVSAHGYNWALCTGKIKSSTKGKITIDSSNVAAKWWYTPYATDKSNWAYITGHRNCMDIPGEWVIENKSLLIIPPEGADPSSMKLEVKKRQLVIDIADRKFVQIEGIKTIGGGVKMNNSEMCMLNGCEMRYISHYTHSLDQREGYIYSGNIYNENDAPQKGEVGIYLGGTDNIIINSTIDHSAAAGIYMVGTYAYIENNTVSNCGYMGSYVSGITFGNELYKGNEVRKGGFTLYNNTAYNCGRSTLNIQAPEHPAEGCREYTSILPYEVAYNDFHDGVLFSLDTGITYEYQIYAKTDKQQSMYHNNYVYYTGAKTNPYSFAIYHDGGAIGIDTYENMVFTTQEGVKYSQDYVFHNHDDVNIWNNSKIKLAINGGPEDLKADEFPYSRPFWAGLKDDNYLVNYERIKNNTASEVIYEAKNAELSAGVVINEDGSAEFSGKDQYICFRDVDFGTDNNNINIYYASDRWNTNDNVDVIVGDSIENGTVYKNNYFDSFAKTEDKTDLLSVGIDKMSGKTNVYLKVTDFRSLKVKGISINDRGLPSVALSAEKIYGGAYTGVEKAGSAEMPPAAHVGPDSVNDYVKNTWPGTILQYRNVVVEEPMKILQYSAGTSADHGDQLVTVQYQKVGDAKNTDLVTIYTACDGWDVFNTYYAELDHTLEPGTYDFYLSFGKTKKGTPGTGTANFWFFGLLPEMPAGE